MTERSIGRMGFARTPEWTVWTPHSGAQAADEAAASVTATEEGRARVAAAIREGDRDLASLSGLTTAGIWVPDPAAGIPSGFMFAGVVRGDETTPDAASYAEGLRATRTPRGVKVFDRGVAEVDVAAGPAVVEVEIAVPRRSRHVVSSVTWMIFPRGYVDTARMYFRTPFPDLLEALVDEARVMADEIVLEPAGQA